MAMHADCSECRNLSPTRHGRAESTARNEVDLFPSSTSRAGLAGTLGASIRVRGVHTAEHKLSRN